MEEYSDNPSNYKYCCSYLEEGSCFAEPSNYFNENGYLPKTLLVGLIIGCIFCTAALLLRYYDRISRLNSDSWIKTSFSIPTFALYVSYYILYQEIVGYFSSIIWFYISYGSESTVNACYLAWLEQTPHCMGILASYIVLLVLVISFSSSCI